MEQDSNGNVNGPAGQQRENTGRDEAGRFGPGNPYAWPKGVSGNPDGRPAGLESVEKPLKEMLSDADGKLARAVAKTLLGIADGTVRGRDAGTRLKACTFILERTDGKVLQAVHNLNEELEIRLVDRPKAKRPDAQEEP